jgi:hypothetical protein
MRHIFRDDVNAPNKIGGMTYQTDRKELNDLIEYLQRKDNLVESDSTINF